MDICLIERLIPLWIRCSEICYLVVTDLEGNYAYVNDLFSRKFSFVSHDFVGKSSLVSIFEDDIEGCIDAAQQAIAHPGKSFKVQLRKFDSAARDFHWSEWEFSLLSDESGEPLGVTCLGYDISEAARAGKQLLEFSERFDAILHEIPDGYLQINDTWIIVQANTHAAALLGKELPFLLQAPLESCLSESDYPEVIDAVRRSFESLVSTSVTAHVEATGVWVQFLIQRSVAGVSICMVDVSQQKLAEEALKESEAKYRVLANQESDITYSIDAQGVFTYVSRSWKSMLGHEPEHIVGTSFMPLVHPDDLGACMQDFQKLLETKQSQGSIQYRVRHLDGSWRWHMTNGTPLFNESGNVVAINGIAHDITGQKTAEAALIKQTQRLERILEGTDAATWEWDISTKAVVLSEKFYKLIGLAPEPDGLLPPEVWRMRVSEEDRIGLNTIIARHLAGEVDFVAYEYRIWHTEGRWVWVYTRGRVSERDAQGNPLMVAGVVMDITEKKEAEEQLRQMSLVAQKTGSGVMITDKDRNITWVNEGFERITGYSLEEAVGKNPSFMQGILTNEEQVNSIRRSLDQGVPFMQEVLNYRKDGTPIWNELRITPVRDKQGTIVQYIGITQDITDRMRRKQQLQESEQRLQKTIEAIPHPFLLVNEDTTIQFVNEEFEKTFDYAAIEVIGKPIDFLLPERFRKNHLNHVKAYLEDGGQILRMGGFQAAVTKSGTEIYCNISLNTVLLGGRRSVIVILQDVTALKEHQDIILAQNKKLREIAWRQSHEVRKPVANILGLCDLIKLTGTGNDETFLEYIRGLEISANELDMMIRQIISGTSSGSPQGS